MAPADLHELLYTAAERGLERQKADGTMPAGWNGPWNHEQTPVRNTGHWAICFANTYERVGEKRFARAARNGIEYLLSDAARPHGVVFRHRRTPDRKNSNGLVGQAWSIEALAVCADVLSIPAAREAAVSVFSAHPFDYDRGFWHDIGTDGTDHGVCATLNQQVWFAAVGSLLADKHRGIDGYCRRFLDTLGDRIRCYRTGLVKHGGYHRSRLVELVHELANPRLRGKQRTLSIGYHSFVGYGLAVLHGTYPDHDSWNSTVFDDIRAYTTSTLLKGEVETNPYAFGYNPTGFEVAYFLSEFEKGTTLDQEFWVSEQVRRTYSTEKRGLVHGYDPETLAARIYEATRLENYDLRNVV